MGVGTFSETYPRDGISRSVSLRLFNSLLLLMAQLFVVDDESVVANVAVLPLGLSTSSMTVGDDRLGVLEQLLGGVATLLFSPPLISSGITVVMIVYILLIC